MITDKSSQFILYSKVFLLGKDCIYSVNAQLGLDSMLAKYLRDSITVQLGTRSTKKIEDELQNWYGITLDEAVSEFDKLHKVLVNTFGKSGATSFEKKFIENILKINPEKSNKNSVFLTIYEPELAQIILTIIEDPEYRKMLTILGRGKPVSLLQLMKEMKTKLTKPSMYRRIAELINAGLIVDLGFAVGDEGRRVKTYIATFNGIEIKIKDDKIQIVMEVDREKIYHKSLILTTMFEK